MRKKVTAKASGPPATSRLVCLEFVSSEAKKVFVAGSFNDWSLAATPMIRLGEGRWVKQIALLPGHYEYRFVVDGQWSDDPRADARVPNPYGGTNAVLVVSPA